MLLGLAIAAPVGPIGTLCIRRTLQFGRLTGLATGMGAATADGAYGLIAALGLTAATQLLIVLSFWTRLVGGGFLIYLGIITLRSKPAMVTGTVPAGTLWGSYASSLALTLSNPATIISFVGIFAGLGVTTSAHGSWLATLLLVAGVFLGSALWWLTLSTGIALIRQRLSQDVFRAVNIISGVILLGFGVVALVSLLR